VGDGGLQKWSLIGGTWKLDYTLSLGLNLVNSSTSSRGTSGLIGLAGMVVGDIVELDPTFLYGISDVLADTTAAQVTGETFSMLEAAAPDTVIRGVTFAPVPEPAALSVMLAGLAGIGMVRRRRDVVTA
jgi:hypothetical protein